MSTSTPPTCHDCGRDDLLMFATNDTSPLWFCTDCLPDAIRRIENDEL